MKTIYLNSDSLFSKWGFNDGDVLDEWLYENTAYSGSYEREKPGTDASFHGFTHALLIRLVRKYLLPLAPRQVSTYTIGSIHNPIRAEDGEAQDFFAEVHLTYEQVDTEAALLLAEEYE